MYDAYGRSPHVTLSVVDHGKLPGLLKRTGVRLVAARHEYPSGARLRKASPARLLDSTPCQANTVIWSAHLRSEKTFEEPVHP